MDSIGQDRTRQESSRIFREMFRKLFRGGGGGTILTDEKLIQEIWKSYFEELVNVENLLDPLRNGKS